MRRRIDPKLTARARALRNNPTPAELAIWHRIACYRPAFTRQCIEAPYIIDLACRSVRLAVELDGSQHLEAIAYDAQRTAFLEANGWRVTRLWNSEVLANPDGVVLHVLEIAAERLGGIRPVAVASRAGRTRTPRSRYLT